MEEDYLLDVSLQLNRPTVKNFRKNAPSNSSTSNVSTIVPPIEKLNDNQKSQLVFSKSISATTTFNSYNNPTITSLPKPMKLNNNVFALNPINLSDIVRAKSRLGTNSELALKSLPYNTKDKNLASLPVVNITNHVLPNDDKTTTTSLKLPTTNNSCKQTNTTYSDNIDSINKSALQKSQSSKLKKFNKHKRNQKKSNSLSSIDKNDFLGICIKKNSEQLPPTSNLSNNDQLEKDILPKHPILKKTSTHIDSPFSHRSRTNVITKDILDFNDTCLIQLDNDQKNNSNITIDSKSITSKFVNFDKHDSNNQSSSSSSSSSSTLKKRCSIDISPRQHIHHKYSNNDYSSKNYATTTQFPSSSSSSIIHQTNIFLKNDKNTSKTTNNNNYNTNESTNTPNTTIINNSILCDKKLDSNSNTTVKLSSNNNDYGCKKDITKEYIINATTPTNTNVPNSTDMTNLLSNTPNLSTTKHTSNNPILFQNPRLSKRNAMEKQPQISVKTIANLYSTKNDELKESDNKSQNPTKKILPVKALRHVSSLVKNFDKK